MKSNRLIILICFFAVFSVRGQDREKLNTEQEISLLNEVDDLIFDYQDFRPGSQFSRPDFVKLFAPGVTVPVDIFPIPFGDDSYCSDVMLSPNDYHTQATAFMLNHSGKYLYFTYDLGLVGSRINVQNRETYLEINQAVKYSGENLNYGGPLTSVAKIRLTIGYRMSGNRAYDVRIKKVDLVQEPNHGIDLKQNARSGVVSLRGFSVLNEPQINISDEFFWGFRSKFSVGSSLEFILPFKDHWKIGLGFARYHEVFQVDSTLQSQGDVDVDGDNYIRNSFSDSLQERLNLNFLTLSLRYKLPLENDRIDISIGLLAAAYLPLPGSIKPEGTFDYFGYYPQFNTTIRNNEELNFYDQQPVSDISSSYDTPTVNVFLDFEFTYYFKQYDNNSAWGVGVFGALPVNKLIRKNAAQSLSMDRDSYNGILNEMNDSRIRVPVGISIRYKLPKVLKNRLKPVLCQNESN